MQVATGQRGMSARKSGRPIEPTGRKRDGGVASVEDSADERAARADNGPNAGRTMTRNKPHSAKTFGRPTN